MNKKFFYLFLLIPLLHACKKDDPDPKNDDNNGGQTNPALTVKMDAYWENDPLSWMVEYITAATDTIRFDKIKFILSDVTLEKTNGELVTIPGSYAFLDLKNGRDSFILKDVPKGDYKSFRFAVGLDSATNHSNPANWDLDHPLNPSLNDMHWGWAGGYIFNVLEGYWRKNGVTAGFSFHVALLRNARVHTFIQNFSIDGNKRIRLKLKADKYFNNVITYSLKNDGSFSHSGDTDPVMDQFSKNLTGIFELIDVK